ncbi:10379_t:CDS:10 [Entrophospora sp. SA101]|nr:10379_t:CDS:10 [Entrophospora sp. SA101]CAJ0842738.1 16699_t:CDS:10 [Entrophospora sp. SA101]
MSLTASNNNTTPPVIRIITPPSSPIIMVSGNEEWDNVDDFSVESFPGEESSINNNNNTTFTPSSPPEEINGEDISTDFDFTKNNNNNSTDILQKMGHWLYNTRLVQYMKSDERSRVKHSYTTNSIWMLGIEYSFTVEDGEFVNLPKPDRGEHARGGNFSPKSKKTRRMTFTSFFSNKEKTKYNKASSRLSPHLEAEKKHLTTRPNNSSVDNISIETITIESKEKIDKLSNHNNNYSSTFNESPSLSNLATNLNYNNDDDNNSELTARPNNSSVDNISAKTITNESNEKQDKLSNNKNKNSISNKSSSLSSLTTSLNYNNNNNNNPENSDSWVNRKSTSSESGSLRSLKSLPPTPTSLYRPDSLGPLTINQKKLMDFLLDFQSRIFCCYRKEYPPIEPSFHTTDTGWGCMHRTGQSLLAQGFLIVLLGRDWRLHNVQNDIEKFTYRKILSWFVDNPDPEHYYSIHNIARIGISLDKKIGDWFGPSTIAHSLKRLSLTHKDCPLSIYVPSNNTIYRDELFGEMKLWKPVLILLSVRLGTDKLNQKYSGNLKALFTFPQFLGIAGGRPGRSLYFVAVQDDDLLYLDPHFVRPVINLNKSTEFPIEDYHSTIVRAMDISEMDPSMLLGFLCKNRQDFDDFCERIEKETEPQFPIFTIQNENLLPNNSNFNNKSSVSSMISNCSSDHSSLSSLLLLSNSDDKLSEKSLSSIILEEVRLDKYKDEEADNEDEVQVHKNNSNNNHDDVDYYNVEESKDFSTFSTDEEDSFGIGIWAKEEQDNDDGDGNSEKNETSAIPSPYNNNNNEDNYEIL